MSTKTVTKRVALATVVALGAGVLSLVTVSSANAASQAALTPVSTNATDGITYTSAASVGFLGKGTGTGTSQTVTLAAGGALTVAVDSPTASTNAVAIKVIGGTIVKSYTVTGTPTAAGTTGGTWLTTSLSNSPLGATIVANAGVTSFTIQSFDTVTVGASSGGTLSGQIVVSIATASAAGVPSAASSAIFYSAAAGNSAQASTTADDATTKIGTNYLQGNAPWTLTQNALIELNDAYGNAVTNSSGTHLLTATATNGALVGLSASAQVTTPTLVGSAFSTTSSANGTWSLGVAAPGAAPLTTTVTIAWDGVTIGTKTFVITGPVAKVTLGAPVLIGLTGKATTTLKGGTIALADSAGNALQAISGDPVYPTASFTANGANPGTSGVALSNASTATATYYDWTCSANIAAHSDSVSLKYTNKDGSVVTSNAVSVACAGAADTYKAVYDKTSYNPGDVATLTITFLDSKGNVAADNTTNMNGFSTTNPQVSVAGGTLAASVTTVDASALGKIAYRVLTGTTSGNFQTVVNVTNLPDGTAQTVALNIASSGTSLNDVLKGIVSLIASINKQIAALAKLVTKK